MLLGLQSCLGNFECPTAPDLLVSSTDRCLRQTSWARRAGHGSRFFGLEGLAENLPHVIDKDELNVFEEVLRHFIEVAFILRRQNYFCNASAARGEHLFFYSSHRKNVSAQSDFSRHGDILAHRPP